jgi:hypothetical protein
MPDVRRVLIPYSSDDGSNYAERLQRRALSALAY